MYNLLLDWEVKEEKVKESMICWAQDLGHNIYMSQWEKLWRVDIKCFENVI